MEKQEKRITGAGEVDFCAVTSVLTLQLGSRVY